MSKILPVSPLITLNESSKIDGNALADLEEEELDPNSVTVNDLISGEGMVTLDENGPGALQPKQIPGPKEMSKLERERHFAAGHLPYDPRCEVCTSCKKPNAPHLKGHEAERTIPLLVGDYGFVKDAADDENITVLILKLYPYKLIFACVVPSKGSDPLVIARLCRFIQECGLLHFAYRSDREPAIVSLIQDACAMAGRNGVKIQAVEDEAAEPEVDRARVAIPEHSHPGESQSNGLAERTVRELIDQVRTLKMSIEQRLKGRLPNNHPVMAWMVEHAAYLLNRINLGTDGRTAYGRLHGKESTARMCEFAERVLWYVPKKHRAKLDARWRYGVFLGRASNCDQNFIGLANGSIVTARAVARLVPSMRWDSGKVGAIQGMPMDYKTREYDVIEEDASPHSHSEPAEDPEMAEIELRRLRITFEHLKAHGYTTGCRKCQLHRQGLHVRAKHFRHDETCRSRIYKAIRAAKGVVSEEEEKRLQVKDKPSKVRHEPKPEAPAEVPDAPKDSSMEVDPSRDVELSDNAVDLGDHMADDTVDFYLEVDAADEELMGDSAISDGDVDSGDHEMVALMDILQTLGVSPEEANRFSSKIMRISSQPINPTFVEMYGCGNIVNAANHVLRNLNVEGLNAFDLRTSKPNGTAWDFSRRGDRKEALQYVKDKKPSWIIGSPPCTAFSRLQGLNFPKMDPARVAKMLKEARKHLHFVISLYRMQLDDNRHFLHEHPVGATSWKDPWMEKILSHPRVGVTVADQCMYGLVTAGPDGQPMAAQKPTKFASSSPHMLRRLSTRCDKSHTHQHLVGGRAAAAAYYPAKLISQILRGIRDTADAEAKEDVYSVEMAHAMVSAAMMQDQAPFSLIAAYKESDLAHSNAQRKVLFKYLDGREVSLSLDDNFKPQYKDEYTNEVLPFEAAKDAMLDELQYFCDTVFRGVPIKDALNDSEGKLVGCRWVNCNKGDTAEPDVRCRLVAQEVNHGDGPTDAFYAATPPLEAKRLLFSQWAKERQRDGKPLKLSFVDIRKAYFNGRPKRSLYVRLPPELGLPKDVVGKLERCMYGTRDAGAIWETCYVDCLVGMGFTQGVGSPCCFYHSKWKVSVVVHGDDFSALGTSDSLDKYEAGLRNSFECKMRGRLGSEPDDLKEIRMLNRIIRIVPGGLLYEADPRHAELLAKSMGLDDCKKVATPGVKKGFTEDVMDLPIVDECDAVAAIDVRMPQITFDLENVEIHSVTPYSRIYGCHPSKFVFQKDGRYLQLLKSDDANCGVSKKEITTRRRQRIIDPLARGRILREILVNGPAWEMSTAELILKVSKKTFKPKRVGAKAAKALEFDSKGEILTASEGTLFRALAARANYLAMDRPETAFATKELCRFFATPTKTGVEQLKRLIRYLAGAKRLVYNFMFDDAPKDEPITVYVDTDFAGCHVTRRSTSGGAACRGTHLIKHWSTTQSTVALSSAEAELTGISKGAAQGLGLQTIGRDLGIEMPLVVMSDATAAIGISRRRGLGKVRHLATADLWMQDRIRKGDFRLEKILGADNPSDILTKHVTRDLISKHMVTLGLSYEDGRADSAPSIP